MIVEQVQTLTHAYVRKGGKDNRKQQRARMLAFAAFCAKKGILYLDQVGKNHVISYWKAHRALANSTAYNHWCAIRDLWRLANKPGEPPKPRYNPNSDVKIKKASAATKAFCSTTVHYNSGEIWKTF